MSIETILNLSSDSPGFYFVFFVCIAFFYSLSLLDRTEVKIYNFQIETASIFIT
jgi:hypothetical protein